MRSDRLVNYLSTEFLPVDLSEREVQITEAEEGGGEAVPAGRIYLVTIIKAGVTLNGTYSTAVTLREAAPLFERAKVFALPDAEHLKANGLPRIDTLFGGLTNVTFVGDGTDDGGELQARLHVFDTESPVARTIREATLKGMTDLFGLSVCVKGRVRQGHIDGKKVQIVEKIVVVDSVDLIVNPAAGGRFIKIVESKEADPMEKEIGVAEIRTIVESTRLPRAAMDKVIRECLPPSRVTEAQVREAIKAEADYLASMSDSGKVVGLGNDDIATRDRSHVQVIEGRDAKVSKMLDAFFDPTDRSVRSIRECYLDITGDRNFTGLVRNCDPVRIRESIGTAQFSEVLGDSIARRLVAEYRNVGIFDVWRNAATVVPVQDFREQQRVRFGGYGDLPVVAEGAAYLPVTSPNDEKAVYAVDKRGGTEDLTIEMITNDDVGAVQRIPTSLVRVAKRTLSRFVLDFLRTNPVIYDGVALFHATHGNLGAAALSGPAVAAGRLAMKNQTEKDSDEKIGIGPRYLWVPDALEETAVDLFRRNTENDKTFVQSLSLNVVPVWYWTDVDDWCLTTDPADVPVLEVGFLGGQEEPELFVQDIPNVGSMFTNDKLTFKIRHIYGATVIDYRGTYKSIVP